MNKGTTVSRALDHWMSRSGKMSTTKLYTLVSCRKTENNTQNTNQYVKKYIKIKKRKLVKGK